MKATLIVFLVILSFSKTLYGQKVFYEGEVRDSLNVPVEFANVMAVDTVKNTISSFAVTNREGMFRLQLEKDKPYLLKITFIGFKPFEVLINGKDTQGIPLLVKLKPDTKMLEGVEVVQEMPVLISGDTIIYKTDAFTDGSEKKLEHVLEKLPGFEVDEDGGIKVQGKNVDKVLVEGKEFFGGDTKMATKNLPANAIDKVQVLENFNDVAPLSGIGNSQQLALNIKLKEDKKNMVFGDIKAGTGPEDRYVAGANLFYYSKRTNINLIAGANNIGHQTFTMMDYFRFTGGMMNLSRQSGSSMNISRDNLGIPLADRNNARSLDTKLGALNFNVSPTSKWRHSGFVIGSLSDNTLGSISQRTYIRQSGDNQENLTSDSRVENSSGLFKYSTRYTPSEALQIDYSAFVKVADISNFNAQLSEFTNFNNNIESTNSQQPISLEQQLRAFYASNDKDVFSLQITHQYKEQDPLLNLLTDQRPFVSLIPVGDTGGAYNLLQSKDVFTRKQESLLNYYRILNKTNHINFKLGNSYTNQELTSRITQKRGAQSDLSFNDPTLNNDVGYRFSDIFFGVSYKTKLGKLVFAPGLNLHRYRFSNTQLGSEEKIEKTLLLPQANLKYSFRSTHSLTLNYSINAEFTDVQNLATGLVIQNYNTLFSGNRQLQNSWYHQFNLNYVNFDMYNFFNVYGGVNYQRRLDGITNTIQFSGLERINSPTNIGLANEVLSGNISMDKRFDAFRVRVQGNISESRSNNLVSDVANQNKSLSQVYRASIDTKFFKKVNLEIGYTKMFNEYNANNAASKFITDQPFAEIRMRFLDGFNFQVDYQYNHYRSQNSGVSQSFDLMNAEISYQKKKSKWEFKAEALNILNTTSIRRDSFSESLISTFEYFIQKRYFMFSVRYDL